MASIMVKRGPQLLQDINGCRYRRFAGSNNSLRHSSQVALSGATNDSQESPCLLGRIWKLDSFLVGLGSHFKTLTRARGGGLNCISSMNASIDLVSLRF